MTVFKGRKALIILLATVFITAISFCGLMSFARANADIVGPFTVTGGANGTDYTYANTYLTIKTSKALTIANTTPSAYTQGSIIVADGVHANITLNGVNIDTTSSTKADPVAFKIADNSKGNVKSPSQTVQQTPSKVVHIVQACRKTAAN